MKSVFFKFILPWAITVFSLYYVISRLDYSAFIACLKSASLGWILIALLATCLSYILRSHRWIYLFPEKTLNFINSLKILLIGFLMNNILPARAGELVRAYLGGKVSKKSKALVLATIASERLIDGLTISLMFVLFAFHVGEASYSEKLKYVVIAFCGAGITVLILLFTQTKVRKILDTKPVIMSIPWLSFARTKTSSFLKGLSPLAKPSKLLFLLTYSGVIWFTELFVYYAVTVAFNVEMNLGMVVLFLVAVNFSSLIPSAPGAIGVIEAAATAVLVSIGINHELALSMVITQHFIQFLVIGVTGSIAYLSLNKSLKNDSANEAEEVEENYTH